MVAKPEAAIATDPASFAHVAAVLIGRTLVLAAGARDLARAVAIELRSPTQAVAVALAFVA